MLVACKDAVIWKAELIEKLTSIPWVTPHKGLTGPYQTQEPYMGWGPESTTLLSTGLPGAFQESGSGLSTHLLIHMLALQLLASWPPVPTPEVLIQKANKLTFKIDQKVRQRYISVLFT